MPRSGYSIKKVTAREVLDSRGNPTVQVDLHTQDGFGRFTVPSGASKGQFEAVELRDGNTRRFLGQGVLKAIRNVNKTLGPSVVGMDSRNQEGVDSKLNTLDDTKNKARMGANALLGVSIAVASATADTARIPLYRLLSKRRKPSLPLPHMNILNGGKHAGNDLSFQEFMVLPYGFHSFKEALRCGSEIYHTLQRMLTEKYGKTAVNVGDEGGFAPPISKIEDAVEIVNNSVEEAGYSAGREVALGIDPAPDSFYDAKSKAYMVDSGSLSTSELLEFYLKLCEKYPLRSIEDPFQDEDFTSFATLTKKIGSRVQIVGDDLFVTNAARIESGIALGAANALLVKMNQAGTLTETLAAVEKARSAKYGLVISHRSGDTEDTTISDLAVGLSAGQIKTGAPARGERTAKYNRLLLIEEELGPKAEFRGPSFLRPI